MSKRKYKISVIQLNLNDVAENNLKKCISWVRDAASQGAEVILLPELYSSHYFCQSEDVDNFALAEPLYSTSFIAFSELAKELGVVIIVPFFEKRMAGIYHNSAYIIDTDGTEAGLYRKMHIPDDPHFYEKFYFTPGDLGFQAIETKKGTIGTLICWDQWYPEAARITALKGAEVLFYPTAIGWHPKEKEQYGENQYGAWMNVMKGHAVANGVFVAAANRIGLEKYIEGTEGIQFWGASFIAGPQGEILAQASHDKEEILIAEVDLDLQENVRQNWPFFRDRRIDAFGDITKRAIDK
ncbi:carbon-nitrogen hydrolase [Flavobacterium johnsoniae]|jgi:N-carbamoylputrescine amidase|uniref:Nitrilase/cyanide hydratase and apolipoprotein N-acyltransferase n=1 Tax=Flavobacterium johnsoniae (strain ATCC 17061 / DSM 2064 / JCM 8514 / BCRC 14874 / CCUG 350202 / NBRC 14942 / NCIMB 11054 / UW101) TaxID=376686 RepID=A5FEE2_FLAJ1|nr:carbon-nitrogen hydrolase [Flavobacterium johnsoniae]ABQ06430.1 Nitrilase/cyanide hydratase and apolipoprotein N-acyltransferase [Flavobacterium johnsoniae UW101]OXE98106.1 acyltransferase [Flavobacterium johnsoniae UW101]WQG82180.1 carbon-nitrogen hydrolase [Flavobacterium johnsoniae UW101]SHK75181.1 N-carbamoylputrescine amidase [Flavobacterium johnsoniae]